MVFMFERPEVYQKSVNFADRLLALTETFLKGYRFLVDRLNRATVSLAANIAEGNGRFTKGDRKNFFTIARGSLQQCIRLLELSRRRGPLEDDVRQQLKLSLEEVARCCRD